ncbi:MAG TPA: TetR/AcrR family transcriptional regulator [Candidatus Binataceae bacterium]|nr:TetR/AcrR family transcriptional regulator [Candidatus Binataceae bacterium]
MVVRAATKQSPSKKAGLSNALVLEEAAKLADEGGYDQLSLAELAAKFGVKPPSLYNHIESLESLKRGLALRALRELADVLGKAAIGKSRDDAVRSLARAQREFVKRHPGLYQATQRAAVASDAEMNHAGDEVVNICLMVLNGYGLDRRAALHALRGLRSAVHGFAMLENAGGFGIPLNIDESFSWLLECFIAGLNAAAARQQDKLARRA